MIQFQMPRQAGEQMGGQMEGQTDPILWGPSSYCCCSNYVHASDASFGYKKTNLEFKNLNSLKIHLDHEGAKSITY